MDYLDEECLVPKIVYQPKIQEETQLVRFRKFVQKKYEIQLDDFWDLHEWSAKNYPEFWECVWIYFDVIHSKSYTEVFDRRRGFHEMQWFKGARLNYAENIFRFQDSHTALIVTDEYDNLERVSYHQMFEEVQVYASALKALGISRGDKVACYMSNRKEAIFAFLATASIGAVWSGTLPLLGVKAVISRLEQIGPKVLFTVENFPYNGETLDLLPKIQSIALGLPSLQKVVIVQSKYKTAPESIKSIPKSCLLSEFLTLGHNSEEPFRFEQVPFDYPLWINYTSGTTGVPKALVHSTGSFLASLKDFGLHQSCERKDVLLSVSPVGWISWTMFVNCLHLGLTVCIYDGNPYEKSPTYYWDIVDKFEITTIFMGASALEQLEEMGYRPNSGHELKALRQIYGSASPVQPHSYEFMGSSIKPGLFCGSLYGSTELLGMCSGVDSNMPVYKGEMQCFSLGIDARCLDDEGDSVISERGDLVISNPIPSMPLYLENDENKKVFIGSYLSRHRGYWDQNDECWINPFTRGFIVHGRSDETMNRMGARFSSSEIYFALKESSEIADSVCVSFFTDEQEEKIVLFVKMAANCEFNSELDVKIRKIIEEDLSVEHVPDVILETPDTPYNLNGKKMDILVKKLINKRPANTDSLINPSSANFFKNINMKTYFQSK